MIKNVWKKQTKNACMFYMLVENRSKEIGKGLAFILILFVRIIKQIEFHGWRTDSSGRTSVLCIFTQTPSSSRTLQLLKEKAIASVLGKPFHFLIKLSLFCIFVYEIPCFCSVIFSMSSPLLPSISCPRCKADRSSVFPHNWAIWLWEPGASMGNCFTIPIGWSLFAVRYLDLRFGKLLFRCLKGHITTFLAKSWEWWFLVREILQWRRWRMAYQGIIF